MDVRRSRFTACLAALTLTASLSLASLAPAWADPAADPEPTPSAAGIDTSTPLPPREKVAERSAADRIGATAEDAAPSLYGWVWDSYSIDAIAAVRVTVWLGSTMNNPVATTTTDADGYYSVSGLAAGQYTVGFERSGFLPPASGTMVTIPADGEPVEANAELSPRGSVSGTVKTSSGRPVAGKWMYLYQWMDDAGYWAESEAFTTDKTGKFLFPDLRPGAYWVVGEGLPRGARQAMEGRYVALLSYSGSTIGGLLAPSIKGAPGTGIAQRAVLGSTTWKRTTFSYRWVRDGATIPKATRSSYTPGTKDLGAQLQLRVTSRQGRNTFTVTSPTSWPIIRTSAPTITGTAATSATLAAAAGPWETGTTVSYQWYADGKTISGATAQTLRLTAAQKGKRITVRVTGRYGEYPVLARTSAATAKVASVSVPTIRGTAVVGSRLTARPNSWTRGTRFSYRWLRDGVAIRGATRSSYRLTSADAGKQITVRVTGRRSGYATATMTSAPTPLVAVK